MELSFSPSAFRQLSRLEKSVQNRVAAKLSFFCSPREPLQFAEKLIDSRYGEWRFRIGDDRVIFDIRDDKIVVLAIGHRKEIYR